MLLLKGHGAQWIIICSILLLIGFMMPILFCTSRSQVTQPEAHIELPSCQAVKILEINQAILVTIQCREEATKSGGGNDSIHPNIFVSNSRCCSASHECHEVPKDGMM